MRLGMAEAVLDDLEDDVERRQREHAHHEPLVALREVEARIGARHVLDEAAIELGLSVLVEADRVVQLVDALERHDRREKLDHRARPLGLDEEVRPAEAEDDAHLIGGGEHGIDHDAVGAVQQRQHYREPAVAVLHARDHVRALVAEEDRHERLECAPAERDPRRAQGELHALHRELQIALEMRVRHAPREIREQPVERRRHPFAQRVAARDRLLVAAKLRIGLGEHVLDVRVHPHRREHAARDRAEEGLGDLAVVAIDDDGAACSHFTSSHVGTSVASAPSSQRTSVERLRDMQAVEGEPRRRVVLRAEPVAALEAVADAARDLGEARAERVERVRDRRGRAPVASLPFTCSGSTFRALALIDAGARIS